MDKIQTSFSSLAQGFQFPNFFELKLPVKFQLPLAGTIDLNDVVFGLCGGSKRVVVTGAGLQPGS